MALRYGSVGSSSVKERTSGSLAFGDMHSAPACIYTALCKHPATADVAHAKPTLCKHLNLGVSSQTASCYDNKGEQPLYERHLHTRLPCVCQ